MARAILIQKNEQGYYVNLATINKDQLPEGDVTVNVTYSSINYKDALAITGKSPVIRQFPMVPGIDLVGNVIESSSPHYHIGDLVLLNGWGVGEKHWGGLAEIARLNSNWLIPLPKNLTAKHAMAIGTAGYTAMLCVMALEQNGIMPQSGKIIVTGANGGVGSYAVAILSRLGYHVIASTGRPEESNYLTTILGAKEIIHREELSSPSKPLLKERWIAGIDTVGSTTLVNVCASTCYDGIIAACGLAQGIDFNATVAPFILRGITLAGLDSVMCPYQKRVTAWQRLADIMDEAIIDKISTEITLDQVITSANALIKGKIRGRLVVKF